MREALAVSPEANICSLMAAFGYSVADQNNGVLHSQIKSEARKLRAKKYSQDVSDLVNTSNNTTIGSFTSPLDRSALSELSAGKRRSRPRRKPNSDTPTMPAKPSDTAKAAYRTPFRKTSSQLNTVQTLRNEAINKQQDGRRIAANAYNAGLKSDKKQSARRITEALSKEYPYLKVREVLRDAEFTRKGLKIPDIRQPRSIPSSADDMVVSYTDLTVFSDKPPLTEKSLASGLKQAIPGLVDPRNASRGVLNRISPSISKSTSKGRDVIQKLWATDLNANECYDAYQAELIRLEFAQMVEGLDGNNNITQELVIKTPGRILNFDETPIDLGLSHHDGSTQWIGPRGGAPYKAPNAKEGQSLTLCVTVAGDGSILPFHFCFASKTKDRKFLFFFWSGGGQNVTNTNSKNKCFTS